MQYRFDHYGYWAIGGEITNPLWAIAIVYVGIKLKEKLTVPIGAAAKKSRQR